MGNPDEPIDPERPAAKSRRLHSGKIFIGYVVAAACLVWVFHDVRWADLFRNVGKMNWWWVVAAVLFDILSYATQGLRWRYLLQPLGDVTLLQATQAIYAGLFVNELLPMRVGEVLRGYLVSRRLSRSFAAVVPSMLVERFFDAIWLALAVGAVILLVPLPRYLVDAEEILAGIVFAAAGLMLYLVLWRRDAESADAVRATPRLKPLAWLVRLERRLRADLRDIGRAPLLYASFVVSVMILVFQIAAFWLMLVAYGLELSVWHGAAVFLVVHLGTTVPSAPSNVGTYQFFTVVGLTLFSVDKTTATGFSVVVFIALTVPLWMIGGVAFARAGLSLRGVRERIAAVVGG